MHLSAQKRQKKSSNKRELTVQWTAIAAKVNVKGHGGHFYLFKVFAERAIASYDFYILNMVFLSKNRFFDYLTLTLTFKVKGHIFSLKYSLRLTKRVQVSLCSDVPFRR